MNSYVFGAQRQRFKALLTRLSSYQCVPHQSVAQGRSGSRSLPAIRPLTAVCPLQAEEAEATYRTCVADAKTQHQELEDTKVTVLGLIQDVIRQSDQAMRSVSLPPPGSGVGGARASPD